MWTVVFFLIFGIVVYLAIRVFSVRLAILERRTIAADGRRRRLRRALLRRIVTLERDIGIAGERLDERPLHDRIDALEGHTELLEEDTPLGSGFEALQDRVAEIERVTGTWVGEKPLAEALDALDERVETLELGLRSRP